MVSSSIVMISFLFYLFYVAKERHREKCISSSLFNLSCILSFYVLEPLFLFEQALVFVEYFISRVLFWKYHLWDSLLFDFEAVFQITSIIYFKCLQHYSRQFSHLTNIPVLRTGNETFACLYLYLCPSILCYSTVF